MMEFISYISDDQYADLETILEMKVNNLSFLLNSVVIYFMKEFKDQWTWKLQKEYLTNRLNIEMDQVNRFLISTGLVTDEFKLTFIFTDYGFDIISGNKYTNGIIALNLDPKLMDDSDSSRDDILNDEFQYLLDNNLLDETEGQYLLNEESDIH